MLGAERGSQGGEAHVGKDFSFTYTHSLPVSLVINFNLFIPRLYTTELCAARKIDAEQNGHTHTACVACASRIGRR